MRKKTVIGKITLRILGSFAQRFVHFGLIIHLLLLKSLFSKFGTLRTSFIVFIVSFTANQQIYS